KTYTFTYTLCDNTTKTWIYTYTISAPTVTMPADGASTVACLANATPPTPPTVLDNCGRTLTVSAGVPGTDPASAGPKTYTFTYTLCDNSLHAALPIYTISAPTVTMPADGASTVACLANATPPTPPTVLDNCGRTLTVSAGVPGTDPACAGPKTYTFTYTLCDNTTKTWIYTYTISAPTVTMPADGASTVACLANADRKSVASGINNCGRTLTVSAGMTGTDHARAEPKTYTFTNTLWDNTPNT